MRKIAFVAIVAAAVAVGSSTTVQAHVTLEVREAPADSYYKATFRVPHGCEGTPTTTVRVRFPEGITSVKPQPKPGWELSIVREKLPEPIEDAHGNIVTERIGEIVWSDGRLLDEHFDEFAINMRLPDGDPGSVIYFPVVQECEEGVHRWIEIPEAGKSAGDYDEPAPALRLLPSD